MSSNWRTFRLEDVGRIVTGKTPKSGVPEFEGNDVPFITPPDFNGSKWISNSIRAVSNAGAESIKSSIIPPRSVLVTCIGSDMGKAAITPSRCVTNQQINALVIDESWFSPEFIYYNLSLRKAEIRGLAGGSAQPILNKSAFGQISFCAPPLAQQLRIVEALRPLDDRITLLRETNTALEAIVQALFKSWFIDFDPVRTKQEGRASEGMDETTAALFPDAFEESELGLVPKGWVVRSLDSFASYLNGLALQKYPPDSDSKYLPVIKIAQLRAGNTSGADRASSGLKPEYVVRDGDVLFSWSGTLEVELWCGGDGALNQHLFKVSSDEVPKWFYYQATRHFLPWFRDIAAHKATTMGHIQRKHLTEARLAMPPAHILSSLSERITPIVERRIANSLHARCLADLRDALLPRLISGQLRLPEAEAEIEALAA